MTHRWRAPTNKTYNSTKLSKRGNFTKASGWVGAKFNRSFPIWRGNLTKWGPLLTKGGWLFQVDISGHTPLPLTENDSASWEFFYSFSCPNLLMPFWGLNNVFCPCDNLELSKASRSFEWAIIDSEREIVCESCTPGKLTYRLALSGPTTLLPPHLLR